MEDIKEAVEVVQDSRGVRGEVGTATASLTIKHLWHEAKEKNPHLSLKRFARQMLKDGEQVSRDWFANKRGAKDAKRSETNEIRARASASATKLSKKGKK